MGGVLGVLQILKGQVRGDDQRPAAAVAAVNHVVDLFQTVLRPTFHSKIVQYQQRGAAQSGYVLVPALKAGGQVVEYQGKVRHADGHLLLHQSVGDTTGEIAFASADTAPKQIADVFLLHGRPILDIEPGVFHLRTFPVVVGKYPIFHGGVSKAPALQFGHGLTVTAGLLLRCLPVDALLLTAAGVGEQAALQRRGLHAKLFRGAALAAVQKTVLAGVVSRFQPGHGDALDDAVKIIHRLSPSLHE